ncbi:hypothetical protein Bbelb_111630 [Branchiostoma belcheri]|nr:hypothetical protein Bbelb_111630 [Branchiostoma belcheri]
MEQHGGFKKPRRRCSVCRRPVKGHMGPCGPGNCFLERSSDEEFYSHVKNGLHMQESLRKLRQRSKVADFVRESWSERISDDSESTQIQHSRSLPLGNPPTADHTVARDGDRAKSEPPLRETPQRSTKPREPSLTRPPGSRHREVRDLRADKELAGEVDKMLEGMLHSPPRVSRKTVFPGKRASSSGSDGSVHRRSDYTRSHGQRRHQDHGEKSGNRKSRSSTRKPREKTGSKRALKDFVDSCSGTSSSSSPSKSRSSVRKPRKKAVYKHTSRDCVGSSADTSPSSSPSKSRSSARKPRNRKKSVSKRASKDFVYSSSDTSPPLRPSKSRGSARKPREKSVSERASKHFVYSSSDISSQRAQYFPGYGKGGGVTYDELSLPMFVHGYVKAVIESHRLSGKVDSKLAHLADLMFDAVYYDWPTVREFHASVLYGMEYATYTWDDTALFDAIRERHYRTQRARAVRDGQVPTRNPGRPRYCGSFQTGECSLQSGHWDSQAPAAFSQNAIMLHRAVAEDGLSDLRGRTNHNTVTKFQSHVVSFIAEEIRFGALAELFQYNPLPVHPISSRTVEKLAKTDRAHISVPATVRMNTKLGRAKLNVTVVVPKLYPIPLWWSVLSGAAKTTVVLTEVEDRIALLFPSKRGLRPRRVFKHGLWAFRIE